MLKLIKDAPDVMKAEKMANAMRMAGMNPTAAEASPGMANSPNGCFFGTPCTGNGIIIVIMRVHTFPEVTSQLWCGR